MNDKPKLPTGAAKLIKKLRADLKDAKKKLTVHQDPKSKLSAALRSLMDQPRKKRQVTPHTDKKKSKYADVFNLPRQGIKKKRPRG
jgi:hypothetical protein